MIALLTTIHVLTAIVLVLSVLMQSSKGSDVAAAFGGMGSQSAFGPRGTVTFLAKATVVLSVVFVVTSVSLVRLGNSSVGGGQSVLSDEPVAATPATPAAPPTPAASTAPVPVPGAPGATAAVSTTPAPAATGQPQPQVKAVTPNPVVPTGVNVTPPAPKAAPATAPAPKQ